MNAPATQKPARDNRENRGPRDNRQDRPKSVYTTIKDFTDQETKVTVRLQRSNDYPRPRYSAQVGRLMEPREGQTEARLVPFLPIRVHTHLAKVESVTDFGAVVDGLYRQAQEYVHNEAQLTEDQILDSQIQRDEKRANWGKPKTVSTGKTERERNKRRGGNAG